MPILCPAQIGVNRSTARMVVASGVLAICRFVACGGKLSVVSAQADSRAPGAPAPPAVYEMAALNARISNSLEELAKACS